MIKILCAAILTAVFGIFLVQSAYAILPTEQVMETETHVRSIVTDPKLHGYAKKAERRALIRGVLIRRFDFEEMAKRSLGAHWRHYPDRQKEFISVFTDFLERSYIDQIESFENEDVTYGKEVVDGKYAEVYSIVTRPDGQKISLDYKLYDQDGDWKVYDVIVMQVSAVNNYRAQFNRVIVGNGFDELMRRLKEKTVSVK